MAPKESYKPDPTSGFAGYPLLWSPAPGKDLPGGASPCAALATEAGRNQIGVGSQDSLDRNRLVLELWVTNGKYAV